MKVVIDASVAVKWVASEAGRAEALDLLDDGVERIAPQFLMIEVANVLWMKVRRGEFLQEQASSSFALIKDAVGRFVSDADLMDRCIGLSRELDRPAYDCVYLACAEREAAEMVTADTRLLAKLKQNIDWTRVRPLTS